MSIARVTMHELNDEGMHDKIEALYGTIVDEYFPQLEQVINIKTGPTSAISIAIYPSFEEAEKNLEGRAKMMDLLVPFTKGRSYHEVKVSRNEIKTRTPQTAQSYRSQTAVYQSLQASSRQNHKLLGSHTFSCGL